MLQLIQGNGYAYCYFAICMHILQGALIELCSWMIVVNGLVLGLKLI